MSKKILIIEPHGDDAFISCSSILYNPDFEKHVVTVSVRSSEKLPEFYPNVTEEYLDLPDINLHRREKFDTHVFNRMYKAKEDTYKYMSDELERQFGDEIAQDTQDIYKAISQRFTDYNPDILVIPVGVDHPYHYCVGKAVRLLLKDHPDVPVLWYAEKPYSCKRYITQVLSNYLEGRSEKKYLIPLSPGLVDHKSKSFLKIYPTETAMLVWTRDNVLKDDDIILTDNYDLLKEVYPYEDITCVES